MQIPHVLIVSSDPLTRAGLHAVLAQRDECSVAGQTEAGDEIQAALDAYEPDLLLWDLGWDGAAGLAQIEDLRRAEDARVEPPIVALLPGAEAAAEAWQAGVSALLPRDVETAQLVSTLLSVHQGLLVIHPDLTSALSSRPEPSGEQPLDPLTPREMDVLQLMAEGLPNKSIARELDISEHTVKFHINTILSKLYASSRTEAVVRATRAGLILL